MLIKLIDIKGLEYWVNPIHVKMLRAKKGNTEVFIAMNPSWLSPTIKTKTPLDEVAEMLNTAMPEGLPYVPEDEVVQGNHGSNGAG